MLYHQLIQDILVVYCMLTENTLLVLYLVIERIWEEYFQLIVRFWYFWNCCCIAPSAFAASSFNFMCKPHYEHISGKIKFCCGESPSFSSQFCVISLFKMLGKHLKGLHFSLFNPPRSSSMFLSGIMHSMLSSLHSLPKEPRASSSLPVQCRCLKRS